MTPGSKVVQMEELAVVAFGCLLHDIGKIVQRADDTPLRHGHARFGADLLQSAGLLKESKYWYHIFECVRYHHFKYIKDGSATLPGARIAFEANALVCEASVGATCDADGFALEEVDYGPEIAWDRHRRLDSIFALLQQPGSKDQIKASFPMSSIDGRKLSLSRTPFPEESSVEERASECYSHLRDLAISRVVAYLQGRDPRSIDLVNDISAYLEGHLRFVPAECIKDRPYFISLYDHLKLTSAFGSCIYAWLSERHPEAIAAETKNLVQFPLTKSSPVYLLLFAEINGCEHFILDGDRTPISKIRARSLYLDLLRQWLAEQVLRMLGLTRNNLLLSSGDRFALIAPNTSVALANLARMQARCNEWLLETFAGKLHLSLDCSEATATDLQNPPPEKSQQRSVLRASRDKIQHVANEPFRGLLASIFSSKAVAAVCTECGGDVFPAGRDNSLCVFCTVASAIESDSDQIDGMLARPFLIKAVPDPKGVFPLWNSEDGKFQSGTLTLNDEASAALSTASQPGPRSRSSKVREFQTYAAMRARLVYPGGAPEPGGAGARRSFIKDLLIEKSIERFLEAQLEEMLFDKESRQFDHIEKIACAPSNLVFAGPADKLIDFAIQLQQRLYKFTSGMVTIVCGLVTTRQAAQNRRLPDLIHRAEELESTTSSGMSVHFDTCGRQYGLAPLSWHDWRREVRPLIHDIQRLRARGSSVFWNQLLEFSLCKEISFYKVLYAVARMDERIPDLRNDAIWIRFKRQRIMPLGLRSADARSKLILSSALLWVELASATSQRNAARSPREDSPRDTGEQNSELMPVQTELDSSPVGGG